MKICGSSVPYYVRNTVPALPSGNTVPFLLRNQMQKTPLRKEIDCFLPARGHIPVISASPCRQ